MKIIKNEDLLKELQNMKGEEYNSFLDLIMAIANSGALDKCKGVNPKTHNQKENPISKTNPMHKKGINFKEKILQNYQDGANIILIQEENEKRIEQLKKELEKLETANKELDKDLAKLMDEKEKLILDFVGLK